MNQHTLTMLIGIAALVALVGGLGLAAESFKLKTKEVPRSRWLMSKREQAMYWRLVETLPEYQVLAQVAFSALLTAKDIGVRNTFDRKVADFVICNPGLGVVAVVELDDSTHNGKEDKDRARDAMLKAAGYNTIRFKTIPNGDELSKAIKAAQNEEHQRCSHKTDGEAQGHRREPKDQEDD